MSCQYRASQFAPPLTASVALMPNGRLIQQHFPQAVRTTVHLDSRGRNYEEYPDSSMFTINLPADGLNNVSSAVLVSAELPLSYYVFSAARGNTDLAVALDGVSRVVRISDGNYSPDTMAAALKGALENAFPGTQFTVTFSAVTMKCSISVSASRQLVVDTTGASRPTDWGLGYYLGLPGGRLLASVGGVITGAHVVRLNPENYLLIDIEELNGINQSVMYADGGTGRRSFAKVPLNGDSYSYNYYDKTLTYVESRPQMARVRSLQVSIRFHDGSVVDLNGGEWSFSLEFSCTLTRGGL